MPGIPFSKACEVCKKRRVKCDELTPCTPCLRLGKGPCPGYHHQTKFIDEGLRLRKKPPAFAGVQQLQVVMSSSPVKPARSNMSDLLSAVPKPSRTPPETLPYVPRPFSAVIGYATARLGFEIMMLTHLPVIHCGRLKGCLDVLAGSLALKRTLQKAEVMPSYVSYIPRRLGHSAILDAAGDLVFTAAGHLALAPSENTKVILMRKYGIVLKLLQSAILDPEESMEADVLAAISLLSSYECINSTSTVAWLNHSRGIYRLIEKRGPRRYQTDFERQLLLASIGTIITIALRDDHACFLDQPIWQDVLASKPADSTIANEWVDSYRSLPLMCLVPRLLSSCRDIVRNRASQTEDNIEGVVAAASLLKQSLLDMAAQYDWRFERYAPVLAPRHLDDSPRVFCDAEDQRAANYGNYLSSLMIVNRILVAMRPSATALEIESRTSAMEIQALHSYVKAQPELRDVWLVHAERVALSIISTSSQWLESRTRENGAALDPQVDGGGNIIERWKFNLFDDVLCARKTDAALMFHYPPEEAYSGLTTPA